MARHAHQRQRPAAGLTRKRGTRPPYDRVLVVCEGKKTEPLYFGDIRRENRVPSAHIRILPSEAGTEPRQIVDYAEDVFLKTRAYEKVFAVFDRDDHRTYTEALIRIEQLHHGRLNDEGKPVEYHAIPSVPCFELWLILHFEDVYAFGHRREIIERTERVIPGYTKGMLGIYERTIERLEIASGRAAKLRERFAAVPGTDPFTKVDLLVATLRAIRAADYGTSE